MANSPKRLPSTFQPSKKDRSLYIHVPFCSHRCGYCNFTLVAGRDDLIDRYLDAIAKEISWLQGRHRVSTIFLGGGTPSHLNEHQLTRLFETIATAFDLTSDCEITVECNPNDLKREKAQVLGRLGVNRISIGVQSFDAEKLGRLERTHTATDIKHAMELTRSFASSVSMDLIFATSGERLSTWTHDLEQALSLTPDHISTYELTYEKGTSFWSRLSKGELENADEQLRCDMYETAIEMLDQNGLKHYEISSFAGEGHRCQHNLAYWNGVDYFAFGPGASRFIDGVRETNHRSTTTYIKRMEAGESPVAESQKLTDREIAVDRLVFGLRQIDGISLSQFRDLSGFDAEELLGQNRQLFEQHQLIQIKNNNCRLTGRGLMVADSIATKIYAG